MALKYLIILQVKGFVVRGPYQSSSPEGAQEMGAPMAQGRQPLPQVCNYNLSTTHLSQGLITN